jgi:predicted PurR-regulated permease PerM
MDNAALITIISTVIGTGATVITLNMVFILKFIKEPLDKKIDRLEDNLQSQLNNIGNKIDRLGDNLQSQLNNVDKKIDRLIVT